MNKFTNPLDSIKIASPCRADWNEMVGDERRRFCGACQLNVYNLSGMTRTEAENLLRESEGRLCVRFYKRADGTVLTKDCPVGWRALKKRISKTAAAFFSLMFGLITGLGLTTYFNRLEPEVMGQISKVEDTNNFNNVPNDNYPMVGVVAAEPNANQVMGTVSLPIKDREENYTMGKMRIKETNPRKRTK